MNKKEALNRIKELEKFIQELDSMPVGYKDDAIFLLSNEEYTRYMTDIPHINIRWWLRTPSFCSDYATSCVSSYGGIYDCGNRINIVSVGVRPAIKYANFKTKIIKSKTVNDRFIFNDFPFRIIDDYNKIAIAEVPITFDVFDGEDNDYENSDIRRFLLDWTKGE